MHPFWLVLVDLWHFFWGKNPALPQSVLPSAATKFALAPHEEPVLIPATSQIVEVSVPVDVPLPLTEQKNINGTTYAVSGTTYVVLNQAGAILLQDPMLTLDGRLMELPFGQSVSLKRFTEQYAEVLVYGMTGFVHKDDITPHVTAVWPAFVSGVVYGYDDAVTKLVRLHLRDEFLAGELSLPLLPAEYISVRLLRDRLAIPWPKVRPRIPGTWHVLLRGVHGVHSTVIPHTDTVMEWQGEDGVGRLAYIEAVLPDSTLKISAVGLVVDGEYTESIVPSHVWREWRPVFINIR